MSPREIKVTRNSRYLMVLGGGKNGNIVQEPNSFILDYWTGRYRNLIEGSTVTDPKLISVKSNEDKKLGKKSYDGPKRPKNLLGIYKFAIKNTVYA